MRKAYFSGIVIFLIIFYFCFSTFAVSTAKIDVVRSKETLADSDTEVIEAFLSEAFKEFLATNDFSDIASLRMLIVSKSTAELESGQFQYGPRYSVAAQKQITQSLTKISKMPDGERKQLLTMNLLILVSDLGNIEISKAAFDYLQSPDTAIRYWSVNCLTNTNILSQLNITESAENSRAAEEFGQKLLSEAKTEESPDILILIAQFAGGLKQPIGSEILKEISQKRINLYLNWQVKDEMVESWLLKALSDRPPIDPQNSGVMMRNFATLYSLVIQRYLLGQEVLPETNIRNLVSVIVQSEKCLQPDLQGTLKRAIEKGGGVILQAEHDSLFGSASAAGKLPSATGFDYGKNPDGSTATAPPTLKNPPQMKKPAEIKTGKSAEPQTEKPTEVNKPL